MFNRRKFIKASVAGSVLGLVSKTSLAKVVTPAEMEGPFYPITPQKDQDFDLTVVKGKSGVAKGQVVYIQGKVVDKNGHPIEDATVDMWQANAGGRYRHPHDKNPVPLDPNFQGWAIIQSGKEGGFAFKTIVPGAYPVDHEWLRPPHIHFKVSKRGHPELTTQMYFPDNALNEKDTLLKKKTASERELMMAKVVLNTPYTLEYTIVLNTL